MQQREISCLSSEELAYLARTGSPEYFAELVRRHSGALFSFLYSKVSNRHDAEDLAQETFLRAYTRIGQYEPRYRFATWLFTIGWRLACSFHRARPPVGEIPAAGICDESAGNEFVLADERENLWNRIAEILPDAQCRILWHKYGEGMSVAEIADKTGKSKVYVKVLLHRARLKLAECMGEERIGGGR